MTFTAAARITYPHRALPDDVCARVGENLAGAARGFREIEGWDFLELVRSTAVAEVCSGQRTWPLAVSFEDPDGNGWPAQEITVQEITTPPAGPVRNAQTGAGS